MKKLLSFILIALFCLPLICCGKTPEASISGTDVPEQLNETPGDPSGEDNITDTDHDNDTSGFSSSLISTEDAYYFPGEFGSYLYYYDKSCGESGVLCGKPECTHDDSEANNSCSGFINAYSGKTLSLYRGQIYYYQNKAQFPLFRINTDGTGREKLFDLGAECDSRYIPQSAAIHRGKLYGANTASIVENAVPMGTWNITCWDLETGEFKLIYEENTAALPTMFFFGEHVYFCVTDPKFEEQEGSDWPVFVESNIRLFRYDTKTGQIDKLLDITGPEYAGTQYSVRVEPDGRIYLAAAVGEPKVYLVSNGELREIMRLKGSCTALFSGRVFAFGRCDGYGDGKCCMNFVIADYDGNILFDGDVSLDNVLAIDASKKSADISFGGAYSADGAFFVEYLVYKAGGQYENGDNASAACIVKYELVDGKIEQTLIGISKWN